MAKRYYVTTRLLENGMIIDQSIKDGAGRILIARGSQINDELLASLKRFGINGVYVREEGSEEDFDISQVASEETIQKIEELKNISGIGDAMFERIRDRITVE